MTVTETDIVATRRHTGLHTVTRCAAVIAAVLALNLVVYAVGRACGATFRYTHGGNVAQVDVAAVTLMSVLPLATGVALTAWLSRRRPVLILIA
jgi:hypothetical protein